MGSWNRCVHSDDYGTILVHKIFFKYWSKIWQKYGQNAYQYIAQIGIIAQGVRNFYDKMVNNILEFQKVKMLIKGTLGEMI